MTKPYRTSAEIPLIMDKPEITNSMKALCMGAFAWDEDSPYYDELGELHEHTATREVPWDLCKQIYKTMAQQAIREQALRVLAKQAQELGEYK